MLGTIKFEYFTQEYLIKLVNIFTCVLLVSLALFLWYSFAFGAKSNCTWQEEERVFSHLLVLPGSEMVNDLRNVAVISLACEFEYFIDVFAIAVVASSILVLVLNINLNF